MAPMRLYTLSKRHFVLVFVVFLICFSLTVVIGIAGMSELSSNPLHNNSSRSRVLVRNHDLSEFRFYDKQEVSQSYCRKAPKLW